jgi:hypothetical protein
MLSIGQMFAIENQYRLKGITYSMASIRTPTQKGGYYYFWVVLQIAPYFYILGE